MTNQRMKWDAEAAFKRIEKQWQRVELVVMPHRPGWTPAPTKPAYSQTNVNAHLEHKGRDYEALTKAALRKPVGYWEDAPRGMKFAQDSTCPKCGNMMVAGHYCSTGGATAPTTTPPADDEFEPVGTMPVVGDTYVFTDGRGDNPVTFVDVSATHYADRVWARQCQDNGELWTSDSTHAEREWYARNGRILKRPTKPRDDVATGARVWKSSSGIVRTEIGGNHFLCATTWGVSPYAPDACHLKVNEYTELHGPERDAIVAECRKAMGI